MIFLTDPCEVCRRDGANTVDTKARDGIAQICPRCGKFFLSNATGTFSIPREARRKVSAWIRTHSLDGEAEVTLTSDDCRRIAEAPLPTLLERAEYVLKFLVKKAPQLGAPIDLKDPGLLAAGHCAIKGDEEAEFLIKFLEESKWIKQRSYLEDYLITPEGHIKCDELSRLRTESEQAFVAMWFAPEMDSAYKTGIRVGIENAGYTPFRVDSHEHSNKIDDEIVRQIRRSRFVVADFTGHRGGVYFEAGFALGLNLPVIWTCRADYMKDLHFDIRQYNCISWTNAENLANALHRRVEALIGVGPKSSISRNSG